MSAGLLASTATPGITAPDGSLTTPAMFPVSACAQAMAGSRRTKPADRSRANLEFIVLLLFKVRPAKRRPGWQRGHLRSLRELRWTTFIRTPERRLELNGRGVTKHPYWV